MSAATEHALARLIGICSEGERELALAAQRLRRTDLRLLVLEAFDQRTEMLADLRLAPNCGPADCIHAAWTLDLANSVSESTIVAECLAGEESTLRSADQLLAATPDTRLQQTLQIHVLRLRNLVSRFRARPSQTQKL